MTPNPHQVIVNQSHNLIKAHTLIVTPNPNLPPHISDANQGVAPSPRDFHLEHHPASFIGTNCGHHCGRDHPSLSNIRVAAPPYSLSPSSVGRSSIGYSDGVVPSNSPLEPTLSHPNSSLASPVLDPPSIILTEKRSPKPETECIHFVDANDITDDEDFFEDDLNPKLGGLEPLDLDTLVHFNLNLVKEIPLDKVCLNDSNLISKETGLTLSTLNLKLKGSNLTLDDAEPNLYHKSSFDLLEPILGVAPLDLHLKESVLPDWAYHITPPTDLNENISQHFHVMPHLLWTRYPVF
ncbi:hypothetical protein M5K25_000004 [Dendrobium thyrsiflorum]|uniref:Uncharacterized protein n=1 Tax=Dendrobium thyrsiflorum TaxID=117978 RepID=A0ABD0W4K0_DENTH